MNAVDHNFVKHYAIEQMQDLLKLERANRLDYLFDVSQHCSDEVCDEFDFKYGGKRQRAHLVDKIFAAGSLPALNMSDKSLIYQAISIFDKYWNNEAINFMHFKIKGVLRPDKQRQIQSLHNIKEQNYALHAYTSYLSHDLTTASREQLEQVSCQVYEDLIVSGFTCLFMTSKNFEVDPLSVNDVAEFLLGSKNKREAIRQKEHLIRTSLGYINESATMFEFLLLYMKIWKIACHERYTSMFQRSYEFIYDFMGDVESLVYDLTKSILVDAASLKYKGSLIVAALVNVGIDLHLRIGFTQQRLVQRPLFPVLIDQIKICCDEWDHVLVRLFGQANGAPCSSAIVSHFENFGRYLMRRQQKIYRLYRVHKYDSRLKLLNIYKDRVVKYYEHDFYNEEVEESFSQRCSGAASFKQFPIL